MTEPRRRPEPLLLRVLRVISLPYRYPPLSWLVRANEWLAATTPRFVTTVAVCAVVVIAGVIVHVWR